LNLTNPPKKLEIHDLDALLIFAGFHQDKGALPSASNVKQNWDQVVILSNDLNDLRYLPASRWSKQQSEDLDRWLNDPTDGVLTWLKTLK
jgi:hypothetical protein